MKISEFQAAQKKWAQENFDWEQSWESALQPLAGVTEELGEFASAQTLEDKLDAIADMVIYLCDVSNRINIPFEKKLLIKTKAFSYGRFCVDLGLLNHSVLKKTQGIRENEDHREVARTSIHNLLIYLYCEVKFLDNNNEKDMWDDVVFPVWQNVVSKRNWKKNAETK